MKKSSFLTFVFSLVPGAGEMYLGLMKKGVCIMIAFWGIIFLAASLNLNFLVFALPVLWFYSFFDVHNLKHLPDTERAQAEEKFIRDLGGLTHKDWQILLKKRHLWIGAVCIFLGLYWIFSNLINPYLHIIYEYSPFAYQLIRNLPTLIVSFAIIWLGIYLIKGGAKTTAPQEDFRDYHGEPKE